MVLVYGAKLLNTHYGKLVDIGNIAHDVEHCRCVREFETLVRLVHVTSCVYLYDAKMLVPVAHRLDDAVGYRLITTYKTDNLILLKPLLDLFIENEIDVNRSFIYSL